MGTVRTQIDHQSITHAAIEANIIRCPDHAIAMQMIQLVESVKAEGDSIGGVIKCVIRNVMPGLGEPVFDKLSFDLGRAMLSINAAKGFEIGSGFSGVGMRGSEHNDLMVIKNNKPAFTSNHAGGTLGGISTGEDIYFSVAFKPVSTIRKQQQTVNLQNKEIILSVDGRHDPCVLPRADPIVDAMAALVIMDHYLQHQANKRG